MPRDVDHEVDAWRERRLARRRAAEADRARAAAELARPATGSSTPRRRWFRRDR
jgi:hypothetical protein